MSESGSANPLACHTTDPIRVTYRDTDRMGHVYHSNYLTWFEIGRTELLRSQGNSSYRDWEEREGIYLPVTNCWADFRVPAHYDQLIQVVTRVAAVTRASITFEYSVEVSAAGTVLATGGTRHAFVNRIGRICRVGDRLLPGLFNSA